MTHVSINRLTIFGTYLIAAGMGVSLLQAQDTGFVRGRGKPGDAGVFINGTYAGPAARFTVPEKYAAPAGEVEVTVRDPRYEDFTTKLSVRAKKTTKFKYSLKLREPAKPPFGTFKLGGGEPDSFLSISAGDIGAVFLNDRFFGHVDEFNNKGAGVLLNPGTYDLHISSPTYGEIHDKITIEANKTTVFHLPAKK